MLPGYTEAQFHFINVATQPVLPSQEYIPRSQPGESVFIDMLEDSNIISLFVAYLITIKYVYVSMKIF